MERDTDITFKSFKTIGDNTYLELRQCVKDIINKEGYVTHRVNIKVFTPDGGNFLGILCEVNIEGETMIGTKENNIFIKVITPDPQMTIISLPDAYKRELFAYEELAPIYEELQNEVKIPNDERYKFIRCYDVSNPRMIVLENMRQRGFKTHFRMDVITLHYAKMAIRELAKFHALSFALESKKPKYFERKIKMINTPFSFDKDWEGFVENMFQITSNYLDEDSRKKLAAFVPSFNEKYRKYSEGRTGRCCLRHGDYRTNNILVKETNNRISEIIPIDYQLICYGSPILDFIYFIFPASDQKFRRAHLTSLKELYYESLKKFLTYFSLDIDNIYPRKDFESDYEEMLIFGLMVSIHLVPFLMACQNDVPDITKEPLASLNFSVDDRCKTRLVGVVQDFIEWGYL